MNRKIKDFNDAMILDPANVAGIFKVKDSLIDNGKIDWFGKCAFSAIKWEHTEWTDVTQDVNGDKFTTKLGTKLSKNYIDWFIQVAKAFYGRKSIKFDAITLYEQKGVKDYPCILVYESLGCIIAPRVDNE